MMLFTGILLHCVCISCSPLNIALHAQVSPSEKIVGSVITTDGLKKAFSRFNNHVQTFYPFHYADFFDLTWDLVLVEGWFPSISEFLALSRSNNPYAIHIFYCLDPTYPGLSIIKELDVDGFLTNSPVVEKDLNMKVPTSLLPLAADTTIMFPNLSVAKSWGAVYVGAGGGMVKYKPILLEMLHAAIDYGLRLHGSHWLEIDSLKHIWQGILPQYDLAAAYASAHVVIATTIESQGTLDMINNRIFEALACGAVVISDDWPVLRKEFGDLLLYARTGDDVRAHIEYVLNHPDFASSLRLRARKVILERHTWSHRVIEILDFYRHLRTERLCPHIGRMHRIFGREDVLLANTGKYSQFACSRNICPLLGFVVSDRISDHSDFNFIRTRFLSALSEHYFIHIIPENAFFDMSTNHAWLSTYVVLVAATVPYEPLDRHFAALPPEIIVNQQNFDSDSIISRRTQRRAALWMGFDRSLLLATVEREGGESLSVRHYELIWYRDSYELQLLQAMGVQLIDYRLQHFFGVFQSDSVTTAESKSSYNILKEEVAWKLSQNTQQWKGGGEDGRSLPTSNHSEEYQHMGEERESKLKSKYGVFICFILYKSLCRQEIRQTLLSYNQIEESSSYLLLVGGRLSDWLSSPGLIENTSDSAELHRIIHSSSKRSRIEERIIFDAYQIFILNPPDTTDGDQNIISTAEDTLWPVLLTIKSQAKIHLYHLNNHFMHHLEINYNTEDSYYMERAVGYGIARLHGFGSSRSHISTPPLVTTDQAFSSKDGESSIYPLPISLEYFLLGVDGQCCFSIKDKTLGCIIRSDVQAFIKIPRNLTGDSGMSQTSGSVRAFGECLSLDCIWENSSLKLVLQIELRGLMFSDVISSSKTTLAIDSTRRPTQEFTLDESFREKFLVLNLPVG